MNDLASRALAAWQSFYLIIGSAAAALIGIQFVVMTLIATMRRATTADSVSAFGTPTVVQLVSALIVSVLLSIPWPSLLNTSAALAVCGMGGLWHGAAVIRSVRRQTDYLPERADWLWYAVLPCGAYAMLTMAALCLRIATTPGLFAIGGSALGLLLIGIHNAWDAVTHLIVVGPADGAGGA